MSTSSSISRRISFDVSITAVTAVLFDVALFFVLQDASAAAKTVLVAGSVAVIAAAVVSVVLLRNAVLSPMAEIMDRASRLSRNCIAGIERIASGMSRGDLTGKLEATTTLIDVKRNDEFGELATTVNSIISTCQASIASLNAAQRNVLAIVTDAGTLNTAAANGDLSQRADVSKYPGSFGELAGGINTLMDNVSVPLRESSAVLQRIAARDLTARMTGNYCGEFVSMQEALNAAVSNLDQALAEVSAAAEQVAERALKSAPAATRLRTARPTRPPASKKPRAASRNFPPWRGSTPRTRRRPVRWPVRRATSPRRVCRR